MVKAIVKPAVADRLKGKWFVRLDDNSGYLRHDMTTHKYMTGKGGTYFDTQGGAQELADRFNGEIGTLAELNVKPGDVVECVGLGCESNSSFATVGNHYTIAENSGFVDDEGNNWHILFKGEENPHPKQVIFRVISRASETPKIWGEMTDAEKGSLLLAHHEGKVIECLSVTNWYECREVVWDGDCAYRIRMEALDND